MNKVKCSKCGEDVRCNQESYVGQRLIEPVAIVTVVVIVVLVMCQYSGFIDVLSLVKSLWNR